MAASSKIHSTVSLISCTVHNLPIDPSLTSRDPGYLVVPDYVDNGPAFSTQILRHAMASLGIALVH